MKKLTFILSLMLVSIVPAIAQEQADAGNVQANNPLANMTALNIQNYYMPKFDNAPGDMYMNTAWIRFVKPFANGKLLLRASAPISTIGTPDVWGDVNSTSGLGDINAFVSYNFYSKPNGTIGIGPLITANTATHDELGSGNWQGGFAFVAFIVQSAVLQLGGLITWQTSLGNNEDNMAAVQPIYFFQLGKGTYLRGAPTWAFDLKNKAYSIPVGIGIGKVVKVDKTVFNLFIEPQYTMLSSGTQPQFQIFTGINLQFTK